MDFTILLSRDHPMKIAPVRPRSQHALWLVGATLAASLASSFAVAQSTPYSPQQHPNQQQPNQQQPMQQQPMQQSPMQQSPMQQQPTYPPPNVGNPGMFGGGGAPGQQPGRQGPASLDQLMGWERQDMGVSPKRELHTGAMHGPTPTQIPGGQLITTKGVVALLQGGQNVPVLMLDILGAPQQLPNAQLAVPAAQPGNYRDGIQQQFGQMLKQATRGNMDTALVLYCQGPQCWMSYNAALRAINLGYKNVLWYRGGLEAWQMAGLPTTAAGGGQVSGGGQNPYAGQNPGGGQNPYGGQNPGGGQNPYAQPPGFGAPQQGGYQRQ